MRSKFHWVLAAIVLLGVASLASATTIISNSPVACVGFGPTNTDLVGTVAESISCDQYSGPGVVTSIVITVNGALTGTVNLTNTSTASGSSGSISVSSQFTVGGLADFPLGYSSPLFTATSPSQNFTVGAGPGPGNTFTYTVNGSGTATVTNPATFAPYLGSGLFLLPVSTKTFLGLQASGGNVQAAQATQAAAGATITYFTTNNDQVPEPATFALLGSGLLALGITSRKRKTR